MKHAKEPGSINSLCGKPVKPYGRGHGRVQAILANLCWNVSQAKPMARENKREWCRKCLVGMGLGPARTVTGVDLAAPGSKDFSVETTMEVKDGVATITQVTTLPASIEYDEIKGTVDV